MGRLLCSLQEAFLFHPSKSTGAVSPAGSHEFAAKCEATGDFRTGKGFLLSRSSLAGCQWRWSAGCHCGKGKQAYVWWKISDEPGLVEQPGADALGKPWVERQLTNDTGRAWLLHDESGNGKTGVQQSLAQCCETGAFHNWWCVMRPLEQVRKRHWRTRHNDRRQRRSALF